MLGLFIDGACTLWNESCGVRQFCWIYDNDSLAFGLAGAVAVMKTMSTINSALAWYFLNRDIEKYSNIEKENMKDDADFTSAADDNEKGVFKIKLTANRIADMESNHYWMYESNV